MEDFSPTDLKTVLHSKRANIYYLEHCRLLVRGGCVEYVTDEGKRSLYWNIPIANTTFILLGTGTSVTQAAVRELAKAGVHLGFCGGGGTPLFAAMEVQVDVSWLTPQSEYRATKYLQQWVSFWFEDEQRLLAAKAFQTVRLTQIEKHWLGAHLEREDAFRFERESFKTILESSRIAMTACRSTNELLVQEARLSKVLYQTAARATSYGGFTRAKRATGVDFANQFLDHGNYLAYGLGAVATWVLGLPHGLAVMHGKTRRGGLVFDVADLVKDALVLPQAFIAAMAGDDEQEFRRRCAEGFRRAEALDVMIDTLKSTADELAKCKQ